MKFYGFWMHVLLVGRFSGRKKTLSTTPCACAFGTMLAEVWALLVVSKRVFVLYFSLVNYQKNLSFYCLKSITGCLLFGDLFSTILMKFQKCDFGAHLKYWKIHGFYKHFSLGPGRCSHFWGFRNVCSYCISCLYFSQKRKFLLSRLQYWVAPFSTFFLKS